MGDAEWDSGPRQGGVTLRVKFGAGPWEGQDRCSWSPAASCRCVHMPGDPISLASRVGM